MKIKKRTFVGGLAALFAGLFVSSSPAAVVRPREHAEKRHVPRSIVFRPTQPELSKIIPGEEPVFVLNEDERGHMLISELMTWYYENWNVHQEHGITISIHENGSPFSTMRQRFKRLSFDELHWYEGGPNAYCVTAICLANDFYVFNHLEWDSPKRPPATYPASDNWVNIVSLNSNPTLRDDENYYELTNKYWLEATA